MNLRIEALQSRADLLAEQAILQDANQSQRRERDAQTNYKRWANPGSAKFQEHYKKAITPLPDGTFPPSAFYIRKPGRTQVKSLADISSLPQAAALKQKECQVQIDLLTASIEANKKRLAQLATDLAQPSEHLTPADLLLSADELQALIRTELGPDAPDVRYDDTQAARLAAASATQELADQTATNLSF